MTRPCTEDFSYFRPIALTAKAVLPPISVDAKNHCRRLFALNCFDPNHANGLACVLGARAIFKFIEEKAIISVRCMSKCLFEYYDIGSLFKLYSHLVLINIE